MINKLALRFPSIDRVVLWAYHRWRSNQAVTMSAWVEICWGLWIITNEETGTARILNAVGERVLESFGILNGGHYLGVLFLAHGAIRWAAAWKGRLGISVLANLVSLFTFSLMTWGVAVVQGWASPIVVLYFGFQAVQTYLFGVSLSDLEKARAMMPGQWCDR